MPVHARIETSLAVGLRRVGGERDDGQVAAAGRQLADARRRFESVHLGHLAVHEHEVVGGAADRFDCLPPVDGQLRAVAEPLEHPHDDLLIDFVVFGDEDARSAGLAKGMWEQMKARERAEKNAGGKAGERGYLDDVPVGHPALTRALKLQQRAARVGFDWKDAEPILDKVAEELDELKDAVAQKDADAVEAEFGDLVFSLVNYGRHLGVDAEKALRRTNDKFRTRFRAVELGLADAGTSLEDASLDDMEALWNAAKKR